MPVTQGDLVTWSAVGSGGNPNWAAVVKAQLASAGWSNVQIQAAGQSLTLTAYAPRTFLTSTEVAEYFTSVMQSAGVIINSWNIKSAGADWFLQHPEDKPKAAQDMSSYIPVVLAVVLLAVIVRG